MSEYIFKSRENLYKSDLIIRTAKNHVNVFLKVKIGISFEAVL